MNLVPVFTILTSSMFELICSTEECNSVNGDSVFIKLKASLREALEDSQK